MENYLIDVLYQLIEDAATLKRDAKTEFEKGRLTGYYQAISRLLNQAEVFDVAKNLPLNLREYCAEDLFDEDKDGNVRTTG